jgi:hypothetical protein
MTLFRAVQEEAPERVLTWNGQRVLVAHCPLAELESGLPSFARHGFGLNDYMDVIARQPWGEDQREIPVAAVSRKYVLVQHAEFAASIARGVEEAGFDPQGVLVDARMSEYGERVQLQFAVPKVVLDPGDGHPILLTVEALNSVDRSYALEVWTGWKRSVCMNSLVIGGESLRKVHHADWFSHASVGGFLQAVISRAPQSAELLRRLLDVPVLEQHLTRWADEILSKRWGVTCATRFCWIVRQGVDGEIQQQDSHRKPSDRPLYSHRAVPGACAPVRNLYHVAQALAWIAASSTSIGKQLSMYRDVGPLIHSLADRSDVRGSWMKSLFPDQPNPAVEPA